MSARGAGPKKFSDPYRDMGDFRPVISCLADIGFCAPHCTEMEDPIASVIVLQDGSNILKVHNTIQALYDAVQDILFASLPDEIVFQVFGKPTDDWYNGLERARKVAGVDAEVVSLESLAAKADQKMFKDAFRRGT